MPLKPTTPTYVWVCAHLSTRYVKRAGLAIIGAVALSQAACAPARFAEFHASDPVSNSRIGQKTVRTFEARAAFSQERPLDLTWVIDNSSSMTEEATHVRSNFQDFVDAVKREVDLKMTLISRAGASATNVSLPLSGPNFFQIDRYVWSTDSLEITAAAFCPQTPVVNSECSMIRSNARTSDLGRVAGKLQGFFRSEAKKAFVFVTDDESRVSADSFMKAFNETFPGQYPVIFSFVGHGKALSPCAARAGSQYVKLSNASAGGSFNICEADWSETFSTVASKVVRLASTPIAVPSDLTSESQIQAVTINGLTMGAEDYSLTPEGLVLDPSWTRDLATALIGVRYQVP